MKKIIIITMALLLGLFIGVSSAVEVNLLGPNKYQRTTGKPNVFTGTFPGTLGTGKLIILNGEANGKNRVSSAIISVNGKQVLGPSNFSQQVYNIQVPVNLNNNNSISVELRSQPGSYLTIQVKQEVAADAAAVISPGGGAVEVTDPGSALRGVKIKVPEGAFNSNEAVWISIQDNPPSKPLPLGIVPDGPCISFNTSAKSINKPLYIKIPFEGIREEGEARVVYTYDQPQDKWEMVVPLPTDDPAVFVAMVNHLSDYVKGKAIITDNKIETSFRIGRDTSQYRNNGYENNRFPPCPYNAPSNPGVCVGMALISSQYFHNYAESADDSLMCHWDTITSARAACEAHGEYITQRGPLETLWNALVETPLLGAAGLDYSYILDAVKQNARNNRVTPLLMYSEIADPSDPNKKKSVGHAVVAYGWEKTDWSSGKINIYNVNYNDREEAIIYVSFLPFGSIGLMQMAYDDPANNHWEKFWIDPLISGLNISTVFTNYKKSDKDNDGVGDPCDICPNTPAGDPVDQKGCSVSGQIALLYDDFNDPNAEASKWDTWEFVREIQAGKLVLKTATYRGARIGNNLNFQNPNAINYIEADVTIDKIEGTYDSTNYSFPSARLTGFFYNDGTGSPNKYLGEVQGAIRIGLWRGRLIADWVVWKGGVNADSYGNGWRSLGYGYFFDVSKGGTYKLSISFDPTQKKFTFGVGNNFQSWYSTDTIHPSNIPWKAVSADAYIPYGSSFSAKIEATFDNVIARDEFGNTIVSEDFSSATIDPNKWSTYELVREVSDGKLWSELRSVNQDLANRTTFKNSGSVTSIQAKVSLLDFQNPDGASTRARLGGHFYNRLGNPNSGYLGDVWAEVSIGGSGAAPIAYWQVVGYDNAEGTLRTQLAYNKFPVAVNVNEVYTLNIQWDGSKLIFQCNESTDTYTPNTLIYPPNNKNKELGTRIIPPSPILGPYRAQISANFDDAMVSMNENALPGPFSLTFYTECYENRPRVSLDWTNSDRALTYDIYRNDSLFYQGLVGTQIFDPTALGATSYTYYINAKNSYGSVDSNSISVVAPTYCGVVLPDLTSSAMIGDAYTTGQTGVQVPVTVYKNGGNLTQGTYVHTNLYWSTNPTWNSGNTILWSSNDSNPDFPINVLNTTGSKMATATINIPNVSPGTYYIIAYADAPTTSYPNGYHSESNENNNTRIYTVSISAPSNSPPYATAVYQYGYSGTPIPEGGTILEGTVVLGATVNDPEGQKVKLQVELRQSNEFFSTATWEGIFVNSGTAVTWTRSGLVDASYKWRYRTVDEKGLPSSWKEFGAPGNIDFVVRKGSFLNGQLLKADSNPDVYVFYNGSKYLIPNPTTFEALGWLWNNVQTISGNILNTIPTSANRIPDTPWGGLIQAQGDLKVYMVWRGLHHIPDPQSAFDLRGAGWNNYINLDPKGNMNTWTANLVDIVLLNGKMEYPSSSTWGARNYFFCTSGSHFICGDQKNVCGYCTDYVATKRKITWKGDAQYWYANAPSDFFFKGNLRPVPGAIMVIGTFGKNQWGHVAFVESVGEKTFTISEMNYGLTIDSTSGKTEEYGCPTTRDNLTIGNVDNLIGFIY